MSLHSMYKYLSQIIAQHLPAEELGKARNVLDTLKGQHMDALQPSPAPAEWIRQVKLMLAYAEAMGFWVVDDEMSVDDICANLDRIAAQFLPAPAECSCKEGVYVYRTKWAWVERFETPHGLRFEVYYSFRISGDSKNMVCRVDDLQLAIEHANDENERIDSLFQPLPAPPQADEVCEYCGEPESSHTRCDACGYTECDKELHGDHDLCTGKAAEVDHGN